MSYVFCVGIILDFTVGDFQRASSPHNNHTIALSLVHLVSMFIGQNVSLEDRRAAQAVRWSVLAATTASSATLAAATATIHHF